MQFNGKLEAFARENKVIHIVFENSDVYRARILNVGDDFVEFEALNEHNVVLAHNIRWLYRIRCIMLDSTVATRSELEKMFKSNDKSDQE